MGNVASRGDGFSLVVMDFKIVFGRKTENLSCIETVSQSFTKQHQTFG
jgi:hypothetical protein